ncbi:MAG: ABC transporter substrate-binding protein [Chloroflexi bacterium]|nr:ABC transporter substrate-binding protein [Chloroflexota bacterium]
MKHLLIVVMTTLLLVGMVSACAAPSPAPPVKETVVVEQTKVVEKVVTATPAPTKPAAPVQITFQEPWGITSERGVVVKGIIDGFMKANPNITVAIVDSMPEKTKVISSILAGKASNVMMMPEDWVAEFGPQNALLDLSPYVAKWSADKRNDFYEPVYKLGQSTDGKVQSAVPWFAHSMALVYNKGMFKAAGLDPNKPPKTWDELYDYAKKLTTPDGKQYGWGLVGKQGHDQAWMIYNFMWQNGCDLMSPDDKTVALNNPACLEALKFYLKLKDVAPPEATSTGGGELSAQFEGKRVAMWLLGPWVVASTLKNVPDIEVGTAILPTPKAKATTIGSGLLVIPSTEKNPDAAWKLIDYLTDTDPQMQILIPATKFVFRLPVRKSLLNNKWFDENPLYKPFVESMAFGRVPIPTLKWGDIHNNIVQPEFNKAYAGTIKPEDALANIEKLGNQVLK